jgi:hypothetical protein
MVTPATPRMTVLHLETGHVLAAAAAGTREFTVDELTAGSHVSVRLPKSAAQIDVPSSLLTAASYRLDGDVLSRPLEYRVDASLPTLAFAGEPISLSASVLTAPDGKATLTIWRVGDQTEVGRGVILGGRPDSVDPAGASHQIVACEGEPLGYKV